MTATDFLSQFLAPPDRELTIHLPADAHERYTPEAAHKLVGTQLRLDVGDKSYPFLIMAAQAAADGMALTMTLKPVGEYEENKA